MTPPVNTNDLLDESLDIISLADTELNNLKSSIGNFSKEHVLLEHLFNLYKLLIKSFMTTTDQNHIPILQMYFITFRSFLVSSQLTLQGHFSESLTIISRASEATGYAAVMFNNIEKSKAWISKDDNRTFKEAFGQPFPPENKLLHPKIFGIYNITREYGSHANFVSTMHFSSITGGKVEFVYCDFNDLNWMKRYLIFIIHSFFEFLVVFQTLFKSNMDTNWTNKYNTYLSEWSTYRDANKNMFPQ